MDKTPMKKGKKLLILLSSLFLAIAAITATTIILVAKNQEAIARKAAEEAERQQIINSSTYHEGVTVNGVSISGMTPQEAKEALKPIEEDLIPDTVVTFSYDNRRFKVTADDEMCIRDSNKPVHHHFNRVLYILIKLRGFVYVINLAVNFHPDISVLAYPVNQLLVFSLSGPYGWSDNLNAGTLGKLVDLVDNLVDGLALNGLSALWTVRFAYSCEQKP